MPEGDTIFRVARTLALALSAKSVTRFTSVYPALTRIDEDAPLTGRIVTGVEARGKHLLMHFGPPPPPGTSGPLTLRTHMRMSGSWHIYRPGERWQLPPAAARIVIETADYVAVAFNVPVAEFLDTPQLARQDDLRRIGPDLLGETFDEDEAVARLRARGVQPIAEALLNQRAVAGIGNVYKSETLFLERIHPSAPVSTVDDAALRALLRTARRLLTVNVADASAEIITYRGLRRTTGRTNPDERLWVYGRGGKPCRRCGTAISYARTGPDARGTYWCPACQAISGS
jgi:endonuclease-8